jgi:hypothetical protein
MNRDQRLIYDILLYVESNESTNIKEIPSEYLSEDSNYPDEKILNEHVYLCIDNGLLDGKMSLKSNSTDFLGFVIYRLTWKGHDYLKEHARAPV